MSERQILVTRIVIGLLVTVVLLGMSRRLSMRRPHDLAVEGPGFRAVHLTVTEQVGPGNPEIILDLQGERALEPVVRYRVGSDGALRNASMTDEEDGRWRARLPAFEKGTKLHYMIELLDTGEVVARVPSDEESMLYIRYKGEVSRIVLILHIVFMFASFYFMVQALWSAIGMLAGRVRKGEAVRHAKMVLFSSFIGGWPLGFVLNYQAFGVVWEGYPFGYDITDNKTQVMFVFWFVSLLLVRGSFLGRGEERDTLGERGFAAAMIVSFIVSLLLFIVPHSL